MQGASAEALVGHDAAHRVGGAEQGVRGHHDPSVQSPGLRVGVPGGEERRLGLLKNT